MDKKYIEIIEEQLKKERFKSKWKKVVSILGCVVVFCTTYALILPAITSSNTAYCGIEEHTHSESCYRDELVCQIDVNNQEVHTHSDECYKNEQVLTCELLEDETHTHSEECFKQESTLVCTLEEVLPHEHNTDCFRKTFICEKKEHIHDLACFSNPEADVESQSIWEKTIPSDLTGIYREDLIKVAKSQLGYKESDRNYRVGTQEAKMGYTRYGHWYGDTYGHWCAMYVSFCVDYAGIDNIPLESNCQQWINKFKSEKYDLYRDAENYIPQEGDIVFFDWDLDGISHHVGIVVEVSVDDNGSLLEIKTIEGNTENDKVEYKTYKGDNPQVMGYAELTNPKGLQEEGKQTLSCQLDDMSVSVSLPNSCNLPQDAQLQVEEISEEDNSSYQTMALSVDKSLTDDKHDVADLEIYDLQIVSDEEVVEVNENTQVDVLIDYQKPKYSEEIISNADEFKVVSLAGTDNEYNVEDTDAVFDEVSNGVTSVSFRMQGLNPVALAVTNEVRTGQVYKQVNTFDEISNGDTIVIVSVEAYIALTYGDSNRGVPVALNQIKGNEGYFDIVQNFSGDAITDASKFTVSNKGTNSFRLNNVGTPGAKLRLGSGNNYVFSTSTSNNYTINVQNLSVDTTSIGDSTMYAWRLYNSSNYLSYLSGNGMTSSSSTNNDDRGMLIFKLVDATLTIPGDAENKYEPPLIPEKPEYEEIPVSSSQYGEDKEIIGLDKLSVQYASDPATSNIEELFTGVEADDGKLLTDKSVIYEADDYNAFTYNNGEFGVTLSALGQVPSVDLGASPAMDVVIILDTSYSMINENYATDGEVRMSWAMTALNQIIDKVMEEEINRVGVVSFSDASQVLLPLDHYRTTNAEYLRMIRDTGSFNHNRGDLFDIETSANLRNSAGNNISIDFDYGNNRPNWEGTFTQSGIQEAAEILLNNTDTVDQYGYARQPVIIMISDGGPTLCTGNYQNPNGGPLYGNSGNSTGSDYDSSLESLVNRYGVNGYYTVLTANYFKNLVGSHYNTQAKYLSVGIGVAPDDTSGSHNNAYCRAVLNPTAEYLQTAVNDSGAQTYEAIQLNNLLNNNVTSQSIAIPNHYNGYNVMPVTYSLVPVVSNPYESFSYADSYLDGKRDDLADIVIEYLENIQFVSFDWNYVLRDGTSVVLSDPIGDGMEVKEQPSLVFGEKTYTPTSFETVDGVTSYHYDYQVSYEDAYPLNAGADSKEEGIVFDLNHVTVKVTTTGEGLLQSQTVEFTFSDELLPLIYLEKYGEFYYEESPIRLIYKVGLTDAAIEDAKGMSLNETRVYYTNKWDESGNPTTTGTFKMNDDNTYNFNMTDVVKTENTTATIPTSFKSSQTDRNVTQSLGNNGRLTIMHETTSVSVEKQWNGEQAASATVYLLADGAVYGEPVVLSADNNWKYTWDVLPKYNENGEEVVYKVSEEYLPGYDTTIEFVSKGEYTTYTPVSSFTEGGEYILVANTNNNALGALSNGNFEWISGIDPTSTGRPVDSAIWTANSSGQLYNNATGGMLGYGGSYNNRYISSNASNNVSYSNGKISFTVTTLGRHTYYFISLNNGEAEISRNNSASSNAIQFTYYKLDTVTVDKNTWVITNTKIEEVPIDLTIKKASSSNIETLLEGAVFDLYVQKDGESIIPGTDNVQGVVIHHDITTGTDGQVSIQIPAENATYYLVETISPTGFDLLNTPIVINVIDGVVTIDGNQMASLDQSGTVNILTIMNNASFELPETGGIGTNSYILGGTVLILSAILILTRRFFEGWCR